ncbi:ferrochelatase [Planctobacterium marinum]|uniref:ferrochelatase n=1 Tax=Planctobacterium marinum TaxID=1631968 RepID=UPI001E43B9B6|nr:ferrochelatase [Planctobacterium marinum]MCC2608145.1 ferrochelatase [Planctobacterium marinum]
MKYKNSTHFNHAQGDKTGVLITNLGTPEAPTRQALRPYLKEFLSDPRVVEVPRLIWWCILNLVILNFRPARSARAYKTVWTEQGSPLMVHTQNQAAALQQQLKAQYGDGVVVDFAMRYGKPAIGDVLDSMMQQGVRKLVILPLYPQYCASTTGSTFDALAQDFMQRRWLPDFKFISHYHDNRDYIAAVAEKIKAHREKQGSADKLIFSYHGIPKRYLLNGDPYHCECYTTSRLIANYLGLQPDQYLTTFQSRFGREEWLKPYTDHTLQELAGQGVKSVQVVCPGFSADCLETIEEIGVENRDYFLEAGGERYEYIECLNSDESHINLLVSLVSAEIKQWHDSADVDLENRQKRAIQLGAES